MKVLKQFLFMAGVIFCTSLAAMAQDRDKKPPPKEKPPVVVVGNQKNEPKNDRPRNDNQNKDDKSNDNRGKKPEEE